MYVRAITCLYVFLVFATTMSFSVKYEIKFPVAQLCFRSKS